MMRLLFRIYRGSPFWLREVLSRLAVPLRFLLRPLGKIPMDGHPLYLDFQDNASFKYYADRGNYEKTERTAFLRAAAHNPGCIVLDLGAHYGAYSLSAARLAELHLVEHVVAFEPDARPRACLERSVAASGLERHVTVCPVIVGDEEGTHTLYLNARSSSDNRTHQVTSAPIRVRGETRVRTTTVDRSLEELGLPLTGRFLIKMDIQGNEPRALRGMKQLFEQAEGFAMFFEVGPYLLRSAGSSTKELVELLREAAPEALYEFDEESDSLRPVEDLDALERRFEALDQADSRAQGACGDFVILRNFHLDRPEPSREEIPAHEATV